LNEQERFDAWKETQDNIAAMIGRAIVMAGEYLKLEHDRNQHTELQEIRNEIYLTAHVVNALGIVCRDSVGEGDGVAGIFGSLKSEAGKLIALRARQSELEKENAK